MKESSLIQLKRRQTKKKVISVFNCLTSKVQLKQLKKEKNNLSRILQINKENKSFEKMKSRLKSYQFLFNKKGFKFKDRAVKNYYKVLSFFNLEIPQDILNRYKEISNKNFVGNRTNRKRVPKNYKDYIVSKHWVKRKNLFYKKFGRFCVVCKSVRHITLHHLKYNSKEFGHESDEDLVALCWTCHENFHKKYGVKKECKKEFKEFFLENAIHN